MHVVAPAACEVHSHVQTRFNTADLISVRLTPSAIEQGRLAPRRTGGTWVASHCDSKGCLLLALASLRIVAQSLTLCVSGCIGRCRVRFSESDIKAREVVPTHSVTVRLLFATDASMSGEHCQ